MKILEVNSSKQNINDIYLKYISYKTLCLKILSDNEKLINLYHLILQH